MGIKFKISDHATWRFRQRFGHVNSSIESLLASSVEFGGQKGSQYLLLNQDHEIVFPIICDANTAEHTVKTVLTLSQAKANLSLFSGVQFDSDIISKVEKIRSEAKKILERQELEENSPPTQEVVNRLNFYARRFLEENGYFFPDSNERKELRDKLDIPKNLFDNYFLAEIGRLIRENGGKNKKPQKETDVEKLINEEKTYTIEKLKVCAKEFFEKYGYFPGKGEIKELRKKYGVSKKMFDNYFLSELGRLIRERKF